MIKHCLLLNIDIISAITSVNDLTITTISTTVTLTWSPPDIAPQNYYINHTCQKLCDIQSFSPFNKFDLITSPYQSSGIDPGSVCYFALEGKYGSEQISLFPLTSATTLSTGNIQYSISNKII